MKLKIIAACLVTTFSGWAQALPPTNLFTANGGNKLGPPTIPPLTQIHTPQFNGDHSKELNLFRRQLESIRNDSQSKQENLSQLEARLATFFGTPVIKPAPGSPGAQFYPFAFRINPSVSGQIQDGSNKSFGWWRGKFPKVSGSTNVLGGGTWFRGDGTATPPGALFTPPANALPTVTSTPTTPTTPPTVAPTAQPPAPRNPVKVSVQTWSQIGTGGRHNSVVMRMIGNFRGITTAPSARRTSRSATTQATGQPSRPTFSRGILFRGHGSFTLHIRSLRSLSAQRLSLRAGR